MAEYELANETFEVPKNTGINGFLHAIRTILELSRVQGVSIDARGKVSYQRFVPKGEFQEVGPTISFETLMPYACVRNGTINEIFNVDTRSPSLSIAKMFQAAARDRVFPVAWVMGAYTTLWDWFRNCDGIEMDNHEEFYGLPILADRNLEDYMLILATANGRTTNIVDVHRSYKIIMPQRKQDALDSAGGGEVRNSILGDAGPVPALGIHGGARNGAQPTKARGGGPGDRGGAPG
jgi:hypothetical protein